ncbi:hypothetical protein [Chitinophaga filiformis]|nr:hypothetical protein [Chitinophaga filiformis]
MTNRHTALARKEDVPALESLVNSAYRGGSSVRDGHMKQTC